MPAQVEKPADKPQTSAEGVAYDGLLSAEAKAHLKALEDEYGQWVAIAPIPHGSVLAFTPGQQVPVYHVTTYELDKQGLVARAGSKEARRAQGLED